MATKVAYSFEAQRKVKAMALELKPNIKAFHEDNGQDMLLKGEVDLVLEYNGDIAQAMVEDKDFFNAPAPETTNAPTKLAAQ